MLQVVSDLHLDFIPRCVDLLNDWEVQAPALVVAGDVCEISANPYIFTQFAKIMCGKYQEVFYVPGNHEYWGSSFHATEEFLRELEESLGNFHFLTPGKVQTYEGHRIVGSTLWYSAPTSTWSDFTRINDGYNQIKEAHKKAKQWLSNIEEGDIVVTHMAPSYRSIAPQYVGNPLNKFFANDLEHIITEKKPYAWIHGHVHQAFDYKIGDTRVLCNPWGYPFEKTEFKQVTLETKGVVDVK